MADLGGLGKDLCLQLVGFGSTCVLIGWSIQNREESKVLENERINFKAAEVLEMREMI